MSRPALLDKLTLRGLTLAPSQVWGGVRLVPILRQEVRGDLRLAQRRYQEDAMVVSLDGELMGAGIKYVSYVPHGLVVSWSDDGSDAAFGTQLGEPATGPRRGGGPSAGGPGGASKDGKRVDLGFASVRIAHRMARREDGNRLRLLPLHLAMEGFLALSFGGPPVAWAEYSRRAISSGLDPRSERAILGSWLPGFDDALRVFEIHQRQVGVLVFIADSLASAFVVSHPEDYAALHRTLLEDFYGDVLAHYGLYAEPAHMAATIDDAAAAQITSLAELRRALEDLREQWRTFHHDMATDLLGRPIRAERVYRAGPFQLQRFATSFDLGQDNHLGEAIVRDTGELEYLKTYRLSAAQTRRGFLLSKLAEHHWNLDATASALGQRKDELILRLDKAGFGYLLKDHVLAEARRRK